MNILFSVKITDQPAILHVGLTLLKAEHFFSKANLLTEFMSFNESIQITVSDSWSVSRRRKSTASSGG